MRVGLGVDAHAFADGVPLVLGGVRFDHPRGLAGHSDGDVLAHALVVVAAAVLARAETPVTPIRAVPQPVPPDLQPAQ